jgi:hypothetical protein
MLFSKDQLLELNLHVILDWAIWVIWMHATISAGENSEVPLWNLLRLLACSWTCADWIKSGTTQRTESGAVLTTLTYCRMNEAYQSTLPSTPIARTNKDHTATCQEDTMIEKIRSDKGGLWCFLGLRG